MTHFWNQWEFDFSWEWLDYACATSDAEYYVTTVGDRNR